MYTVSMSALKWERGGGRSRYTHTHTYILKYIDNIHIYLSVETHCFSVCAQMGEGGERGRLKRTGHTHTHTHTHTAMQLGGCVYRYMYLFVHIYI